MLSMMMLLLTHLTIHLCPQLYSMIPFYAGSYTNLDISVLGIPLAM